jgi:hypothetical protein
MPDWLVTIKICENDFIACFIEFLGYLHPFFTIHSLNYTVHSFCPQIPKGSEIALWYQTVNTKKSYHEKSPISTPRPLTDFQ